ncbi:hypothetical protein [Streptomyces sp. NPDC056061]|uniref:hypothetical protein n=1 Tax=Streptomyces sp. NPDC056061 TaxID=3345700 RepID=UPI0035E16B16
MRFHVGIDSVVSEKPVQGACRAEGGQFLPGRTLLQDTHGDPDKGVIGCAKWREWVQARVLEGLEQVAGSAVACVV